MKLRGLIAAVVVLAALGGLLWWSQRHQPNPTPASPALPAILKIDAKDVTGITLQQKGQPPIVLVPSGSTAWKITEPASYRANAESTEQILSALGNLVPQRVVDEKPANLATYGLSDPDVTVAIAEKNNQSIHLLLGDKTPTADNIYAMVSGNPRVYTVEQWVDSTFAKSLNDLRDKHLIPVRTQDVNQVEILRKDQDLAFSRIPGGWQIQKPAAYRTNNYEVDDLVSQLTSATWDPAAGNTDAAAAFDHGTLVATAKVTADSGTQAQTDTLEVRKTKDGSDYAKATAVPGVWKVESSLATALDRDSDAYRNKQLLGFGYTDPLNIVYRAGSTDVSLVHSGNDWYSNGKTMDSTSVEAVVTALRDLAASNFVDSGFSRPDIDLTVVSGGGHTIEKVHFQKTAEGAIAKRDDDPGLYVLDANAMNALETAIAEVKPAAPTTKKK
ncbi:MAG: DUF4340 domain-containing protein [Acidobacteriaceae bacterium]